MLGAVGTAGKVPNEGRARSISLAFNTAQIPYNIATSPAPSGRLSRSASVAKVTVGN